MAWLFAFFEVFTSEGTTPFSINNQKLYLYNLPVKWYLGSFLLVMIVYYIWVVIKMSLDIEKDKRVFTINRRYRAYLLERSSVVMSFYYKLRLSTLVDNFIFVLQALAIVSLIQTPFVDGMRPFKAIFIISVHYLLEKRERVNLKLVDEKLRMYFGVMIDQNGIQNNFKIVSQEITSDFSVLYMIVDLKTGIKYWIKP
ncbi:MAG: hypothetical protein GX963_02960 [Bacteroidales bacterium]|nr:hypothetical protein [Bacteroidales bacterium]